MQKINLKEYKIYDFNDKYFDTSEPFNKVLRLIPNDKKFISLSHPKNNNRKDYKIAIYQFIKNIFYNKKFHQYTTVDDIEVGLVVSKEDELFKHGFYLKNSTKKKAITLLNNVIENNIENCFARNDSFLEADDKQKIGFESIYLSDTVFFYTRLKIKNLKDYQNLKKTVALNTSTLFNELNHIESKLKNCKNFETIFSDSIANEINCLVEKETKVSLNSSIVSIVDEFIDEGRAGDINAIELVRKTYNRIWNEITSHYPEIKPSFFSNLNSFLNNYEVHMFQFKFYRDHSVHMFVIFVLGLIIINKIGEKKIVGIMRKAYAPLYRGNGISKKKRRSLYDKLGLFKSMDDVIICWSITSLLHDISLPLEKAKKFIETMLTDQLFTENEKEFIENSDILGVTLNTVTPMFSPSSTISFRILSHFYSCLYMKQKFTWEASQINYRHDCPFRYRFGEHIWKNFDHGILGAMKIITKFFENHEKRNFLFKIMPAVSAIASHNCLLKNSFLKDKISNNSTPVRFDEFVKNKVEDRNSELANPSPHHDLLNFIEFEIHPLAFLLIYCDTAHEWGREDQNASINQDFNLNVEFDNSCGPDRIELKLTYPLYENPGWEIWKVNEFNETYSTLISNSIKFGVTMPGFPYDTSAINTLLKNEKYLKNYNNSKRKFRQLKMKL